MVKDILGIIKMGIGFFDVIEKKNQIMADKESILLEKIRPSFLSILEQLRILEEAFRTQARQIQSLGEERMQSFSIKDVEGSISIARRYNQLTSAGEKIKTEILKMSSFISKEKSPKAFSLIENLESFLDDHPAFKRSLEVMIKHLLSEIELEITSKNLPNKVREELQVMCEKYGNDLKKYQSEIRKLFKTEFFEVYNRA